MGFPDQQKPWPRGVSWGGALGAWAPRGHQRGAKKKEKRKRKERERGKIVGKKRKKNGIRKKKGKKAISYLSFQVQAGAPGKKTSGAPNWRRKGREGRHSFKCKQVLQGRRHQGRQIDGEKDERGAMQFQVQAGAPGEKTSGVPNWRRKGREGRHAVSSASRGSREESVRGAKLTEKRTRGAPCSFKCKQGLQGRKRQGRQIDGETDERGAMQFKCKQGLQGRTRQGRQIHREKDERCANQFKCKQGLQGRKRQGRQIDGEKDEKGAMQFQVQAGAPGKKMSGVPNWRRQGRERRHAVFTSYNKAFLNGEKFKKPLWNMIFFFF